MRFVDRPEFDMQDAQTALNRTHKYNCSEVKDYLSRTYRNLCAYCECEVEVSNFLEIEHFYPKSQYRGFETDIHNLHLACKRCNNPKGSKMVKILSPNFYLEDPDGKMLDWVVSDENRLSDKIRYCGHMLYSPSDDDIAKNTISTLRLNNDKKTDRREQLIESRLRVYDQAWSSFKTIIEITSLMAMNYKDILSRSFSNEGFKTSVIVDYYTNNYHHNIDGPVKNQTDSLNKMMKHGYPYSQMIIDNFAEPLAYVLSILVRLDWRNTDDQFKLEELESVVLCLNRLKGKFSN